MVIALKPSTATAITYINCCSAFSTMTVKDLIKELQSLKPELQNKPVYTYERDGNMSIPKVKTILKDSYNPLNQSTKNVIGIFVGS